MNRFFRFSLTVFYLVINMSFLTVATTQIAHAATDPCAGTSATGGAASSGTTGFEGATASATASDTTTCSPYAKTGSYSHCFVDTTTKGILLSHPIVASEDPMSNFTCYVGIILTENMPFVMIGATLWIIISGIMYMVSGGSPAELTKAKQRIFGVLGGVALYFLIRFLVPVIISGLSL